MANVLLVEVAQCIEKMVEDGSELFLGETGFKRRVIAMFHDLVAYALFGVYVESFVLYYGVML